MVSQVVGREVREMFGAIAGRYDSTNTVLSFGIHFLWRRILLNSIPGGFRKDETALDLCTGTADLVPLLRKRFGFVTGADFCNPMLVIGKEKLRKASSSAPLIQADSLSLPFQNASADCITCSFGLRNLEDLRTGLLEIKRVLKEGGELRVLEFGQPSIPVVSSLFRFYSDQILPRIGGWMTGNKGAYEYLPATSAAFPCREQFCQILREAGFEYARCRPLTGGIAFLYEAH